MSTVDNSFQKYNSLSQTESRLIEGRNKLDLKLYQKNSMNKINFRSFLGKNYICSCQDKYKKIRIPIVAVFLKILQTKTTQNLERLQKLKTLIYSQKLEQIVKKHGITADQLLTNFIFAISEFQPGTQKVESQFIKKINSEPFFDQIIMESFYEMFFDPGLQTNLTANISKWIKQELGISVVFEQNQTESQNDSLVFLKRNERHEILRIMKSFNICSMTSIYDDTQGNETPIKRLNTNRQSGKVHAQQNLFKSISSCESPTLRNSSIRKFNECYVPISMQKSLQLIENKENKFVQQKTDDQTCREPIQKRRPHQSESTFWKIFCCGGD